METHFIIEIIGNIEKIAHGLTLETDAQADVTGEYYLTGAINMCTSKRSKTWCQLFNIDVTKVLVDF